LISSALFSVAYNLVNQVEAWNNVLLPGEHRRLSVLF